MHVIDFALHLPSTKADSSFAILFYNQASGLFQR